MKIFLSLLVLGSISFGLFSQLDYQLAFLQQDTDKPKSQNTVEKTASTLDESLSLKQTASSDLKNEEPSEFQQDHFIPNPDAVNSLRDARVNGDSRAPELGEHHEREKPTEEELGDHEQYLEYEKRQQKRVYRAYVEASKIKTKQIQDMIERGKAEGVSDEEIAFAENKIRGIEEMAAELQRDYPDIMEDSYQPPADWLIENLGKEADSNENEGSDNNIEQ